MTMKELSKKAHSLLPSFKLFFRHKLEFMHARHTFSYGFAFGLVFNAKKQAQRTTKQITAACITFIKVLRCLYRYKVNVSRSTYGATDYVICLRIVAHNIPSYVRFKMILSYKFDNVKRKTLFTLKIIMPSIL